MDSETFKRAGELMMSGDLTTEELTELNLLIEYYLNSIQLVENYEKSINDYCDKKEKVLVKE